MIDNTDNHEEAPWELVEVECWSCGIPHMNLPDVAFPMCDQCIEEHYDD